MKRVFSVVLFSLFLIMALSFVTSSYAAEPDPTLSKVLLSEWRYYHSLSGTRRGSFIFENPTSGTIADGEWGEGTFTGKFTKKDTFEGTATFKDPKMKDEKFTMSLKFKQRFKKWSFKGKIKGAKESFKMSNGERVTAQ